MDFKTILEFARIQFIEITIQYAEDLKFLQDFYKRKLSTFGHADDDIDREIKHCYEVAFTGWLLAIYLETKVKGIQNVEQIPWHDKNARKALLAGLLHDIGKGHEGEPEKSKIEFTYPFQHHTIGADIVLNDPELKIRGSFLGVANKEDLLNEISNAIRKHSARCKILDILKREDRHWYRYTSVIGDLSRDEHNFETLGQSDNYIAKLLSDADNIALIIPSTLINEVGEQLLNPKFKFLLNLVIQENRLTIIGSDKEKVEQAAMELKKRVEWLRHDYDYKLLFEAAQDILDYVDEFYQLSDAQIAEVLREQKPNELR